MTDLERKSSVALRRRVVIAVITLLSCVFIGLILCASGAFDDLQDALDNDNQSAESLSTTTTLSTTPLFQLRRRLQNAGGNYNVSSEEMVMLMAALVFVVFGLLLCCCVCAICSGGGRGCSLWDIVAMVCLWEMCCDRDGGNMGDYNAC